MSTSFEILPTTKNNPNCDEIVKYSVELFSEFLKRERISQKIEITTREVTADNKVYLNPASLVLEEHNYTVFNLNEEGEVYVFYHKLLDIDKECWDEEIQSKKHALFKAAY